MQSLEIKCYKHVKTVTVMKEYIMNHTKNPTALQSQKFILQALLDLMGKVAYDKISVSDICRKADVDRRTFYRNFDSKNEVLEHHIICLSKEYIEEFNRMKIIDKYTATLLFFDFWEKHLSLIQNMKKCGLSDFVFSHFEHFVKSNQKLLIRNDLSDSTLHYLYAYRIGGFWNVMLTWASDDAKLSSKELATLISDL